MNLALSLRSELVKSRRTSILYLAFVAATLAPIYSYLDSSSIYRLSDLKSDPWNIHLLGFGGRVLNMMILPFFIMLICTLQAQLEYRNNTWKQVYVSPQPLSQVFLSKYLIIQLLLLGVIISGLLMVVALYAVDHFDANLDLSKHTLDWSLFLDFWIWIYISVLALSSFQFWLGLRFKSFVVPIVIGICLFLAAAMMTEEHPQVHDDKFPCIYPLRNCFPKHPSERLTMLWGSIAYTILFLVLGLLDFTRRRISP
jgi:hypothetical protein